MFSRCPHCAYQHPVTVEQLRRQRGLLKCGECGQAFDALRFLTEVDESLVVDDDALAPDALAIVKRPRNSAVWFWGSGVAFLLLVLQTLYFETYGLLMQPQIREPLDKICATMACQIPEYKNIDELAVSHSDLLVQDGGTYVFNTAISNQAPFAQPAPELKLTLLNFSGQVLAERVFDASHYRQQPTSLAPADMVEVRLTIVAPIAPIGGYTFTLL